MRKPLPVRQHTRLASWAVPLPTTSAEQPPFHDSLPSLAEVADQEARFVLEWARTNGKSFRVIRLEDGGSTFYLIYLDDEFSVFGLLGHGHALDGLREPLITDSATGAYLHEFSSEHLFQVLILNIFPALTPVLYASSDQPAFTESFLVSSVGEDPFNRYIPTGYLDWKYRGLAGYLREQNGQKHMVLFVPLKLSTEIQGPCLYLVTAGEQLRIAELTASEEEQASWVIQPTPDFQWTADGAGLSPVESSIPENGRDGA